MSLANTILGSLARRRGLRDAPNGIFYFRPASLMAGRDWGYARRSTMLRTGCIFSVPFLGAPSLWRGTVEGRSGKNVERNARWGKWQVHGQTGRPACGFLRAALVEYRSQTARSNRPEVMAAVPVH